MSDLKFIIKSLVFAKANTRVQMKFIRSLQIHIFTLISARINVLLFFGTYRSRDVRFVSIVVDIARVDRDFFQMYKITYL